MRYHGNVFVWSFVIIRTLLGTHYNIFYGGALGNFLGHDMFFSPLGFWWVIACAIIIFQSQTQDLDGRKHLLDFFFPMTPLARFQFFFQQFLRCRNFGGHCPIPPSFLSKNNGPSLIRPSLSHNHIFMAQIKGGGWSYQGYSTVKRNTK